ncbi:beige beach domain-containing protein [Ophiostoma piceae UAMH 11346]|uniref:Beige beach domain-containing protein n=1 Tax=Ophiostoma piceae (strain UAMH 11346) TaxID=1262450 RepID=S3BXK6_OPHP1|nr:beige beach domain-containing protein [Ophiostoma piceae UAMH 11346]
MATRPSRYRSSTSASNPPTTTKAAEVLQSLLHGIVALISPPSSSPSRQSLLQQPQHQHLHPDSVSARSATPPPPRRRTVGGYPDVQYLLKYCRQIHQYLTAHTPPSTAQDDFRHMHGFQLLLSVLRSFSGFYNPQVRSESEKRALFELLHATLAVLSAAFRGHHGNQRYFHHRVEGGGWEALEQVIASIGLGVSDSDLWSNCQLYGKLLSFALDDQRMDELCQWVATVSAASSTPSASPTEALEASISAVSISGIEVQESSKDGDSAKPTPSADGFDADQMKAKLNDIITPKTELQNAEVMRAVIGFWESIPRSQDGRSDPISLVVLDTVATLLNISLYNLSALHSTGILSRFLRLYFAGKSPLSAEERERILPICRSLMYLGVNQLSDAQFLLSSTDHAASVFCLEMASKYTGPPFVQFDLSHYGHSSIELPNLGRSFPPMTGNGFTFTCWMRIDTFDPKSHTTIFGVFDASQTCFLLLYLERDTRNFILQTSVTSSRPSVRFRSVSFQEKQWYHVALVHRRGKTRASLYVNGEFVEQVKAAYPLPPPSTSTASDSFVSFGTGNRGKPHPVQAFLGTPKDLAVQTGPGLIVSKWSLASAHLFEDALSDDYIAVHYRLGPRYQANYQDSLGGFQTYTASARLALLNDFNGSKDDNSDILHAIRDKASTIVPEQKILMSTLPRSMFRTDGAFLESLLFRSLSRASAANLLSLTAKSGTAVAINGALPCVNDALVRSHGVSILTGDPVLVTPFYFDDNLWRLAGFTPLALKLIERTTTAEELIRSTEMAFQCINSSWRNSESMERDNGYVILGMLLRGKLGFGAASTPPPVSTPASDGSSWRPVPVTGDRQETTFRLLKLVLAFVGYDFTSPIDSFCINPLAYRILLIDLDIWRKAGSDTQRLYYEQFETFAIMSKFHQFNNQRLLRMRIIKRLLDAMKIETVSEEALPYFLKTFESLVRSNYNAEAHRALALFITYALHSPAAMSASRAQRSQTGTVRSSAASISGTARRHTGASSSGAGGSESSSLSGAPADAASKALTKRQLGVRILKLYEHLLCEKGTLANIRKFNRTVTNKWLLYLLSSPDVEVLTSGIKILARLLVSQGASSVAKFVKVGGFGIMSHRLKHWWDAPTVWVYVLAILFGNDVTGVDIQGLPLSYDMLLSIFGIQPKVVYPDALVVVVSMLGQGLGDILKTSSASPIYGAPSPGGAAADAAATTLDNTATLESVVHFFSHLHRTTPEFRDFVLQSEYVRLLSAALFPSIVSMEALAPEMELGSKDAPPRFDGADVVVRQRLTAPTMMRTISINSNMSSSVHSTIGGSTVDVAADSALLPSTESVHTSAGRPGPSTTTGRPQRSSSFILLTAQANTASWHTAKLTAHASPKRQLIIIPHQRSNSLQNSIMGLVVETFVDQVLVRKEFPGFSLGLRTPPSFQEHQSYFESYILRNTILRIQDIVKNDMRIICEPKVLTNMARFTAHMVDSTFDSTFANSVDVLMDFTGMILEYLNRPDIAALKSVRLCNPAVKNIRLSFLKLVLFRLSDVDAETEDSSKHSDTPLSPGGLAAAEAAAALPVLERVFYWHSILIDCLSNEITSDEYHMKLMFYQLYNRLLDPNESVRLAAASIWRVILVQKPNESSTVLRQCATTDQLHLARSFRNLTEVDDGVFLEWVDKHRPSLDAFFLGGMSKFWEDFVMGENTRVADSTKLRLTRRREKLKQWQIEAADRSTLLLRHDMANSAWMKSIFNTEHTKLQRQLQDQQDDLIFHVVSFVKMERDLKRPGAVFSAPGAPIKWKLDRTEGRNRMRLRLLPDSSDRVKDALQSKQKAIDNAAAVVVSPPAPSAPAKPSATLTPSSAARQPPPLDTSPSTLSASSPAASSALSAATIRAQNTPTSAVATTPSVPFPPAAGTPNDSFVETSIPDGASGNGLAGALVTAGVEPGIATEEDFEMIDDPNEPDGEDGYEDKNRKVMRRLNHGDVVQTVFNVSRIIGLDACDGILIVGKDALYIMDNVFQCRDGEIVNAWQAPEDERDPFSQIITTNNVPSSHDKANAAGGPNGHGVEQESRSWRWHDVISVSKRRFLFRDVAIEVFFRDGRSYLLTTIDNAKRDDVYGRLMAKIPHATGPANALPNPEDAWRLEGLRLFEEAPQSFGSKFGSIFNSSPWSPSMRRWQKGETSNFNYLMQVNTMAGRTFNDLTQYPVFPWVLADYTSEELDLTNPATFRDLSKPMGAQTAQRQADFNMRYQSLAELGQPPFHYGTHYSSAMVVSSYLIRLPPFVQSFLLLQGGHFDHPDRLFYSIEGAWKSSSHDNGADVRELIPEFFCLPEFLVNINGYDFGRRQDGSKIDNVVLPPWAKGDPNIFITKHREALESPYVSQNLHKWIDLVFGHKQKGDAAVENLNVFHHLSYHGAIDLDNIEDPQERAIVTGIIHNFGQTPRQIFSRPHPAREHDTCPIRRLDATAESLSRIPHAILESRERVASLIYVPKLDRLLCASPFRLNLPPVFDKYLEWGYADNSIRFFHSDNRKLAGLFENLHIGQISCVAFADSKTLITAGEDCAVSVFAVVQSGSNKPVELLTRSSLFGHKTPVTTVAVSNAFSTLLTVSQDGVAMLWDLNRLEFIRKLPGARPVECARINDVTGDIMLCSGPNVVLYTLNGDLLLDQNVCNDGGGPEDYVHSCAFYEGAGNEWLENCLVFTGHRRGRVNIWRKTVNRGRRGRWMLELVRRLDHVDPKSEVGANVDAAITCITPMPQLVYTGDDDGRVYEWNLIQRDR